MITQDQKTLCTEWIEKNRGISVKNIDRWSNRIEKSHKELYDILGQSTQKTIKIDDYDVTISFAPLAFAKIGHYVVDKYSCFRQRGTNRQHKYRYSVMKSSFVIVAKKINKVIFRGFGFLRGSTPYIHNVYENRGIFRRYDNYGNFMSHYMNPIKKALSKFFSQLLETKLRSYSAKIQSGEPFYLNDNSKWIFSNKNSKKKVYIKIPKNIYNERTKVISF